ncbi:hypothetical protein WMY93_020441 [Mugilogobius chulae]|uniref:Uncharacterized protein n=1 Tax=Mugilogobius chulae TaxID=88201 RepID=A0AAW0NIE2_9GOBI
MKQPGQWSQWWRMKGPVALLTLALVMSMVEPSEGFWEHIVNAAGHLVHGFITGKKADQEQDMDQQQEMDQQQDMDQQDTDQQQQQEEAEKVFVDKRSADYVPGPQ